MIVGLCNCYLHNPPCSLCPPSTRNNHDFPRHTTCHCRSAHGPRNNQGNTKHTSVICHTGEPERKPRWVQINGFIVWIGRDGAEWWWWWGSWWWWWWGSARWSGLNWRTSYPITCSIPESWLHAQLQSKDDVWRCSDWNEWNGIVLLIIKYHLQVCSGSGQRSSCGAGNAL